MTSHIDVIVVTARSGIWTIPELRMHLAQFRNGLPELESTSVSKMARAAYYAAVCEELNSSKSIPLSKLMRIKSLCEGIPAVYYSYFLRSCYSRRLKRDELPS